MTLTELQVLEGMAGRVGFPDLVKTLMDWRYACSLTPWPIRLREFLDLTLANPNRPLSSRVLANNNALLRRLSAIGGE